MSNHKYSGIGKNKFDKIVSLFSSGEINGKVREEFMDANSSKTSHTQPERASFKEKVSMWNDKIEKDSNEIFKDSSDIYKSAAGSNVIIDRVYVGVKNRDGYE